MTDLAWILNIVKNGGGGKERNQPQKSEDFFYDCKGKEQSPLNLQYYNYSGICL